jgi:antitoxin component YwqK of YwqJK toxin-antitoxin module
MKLSELLNLTDEQKEAGVWFSGVEGEGEHKRWHENGNLYEYSNWKNGKRHGEYKWWHYNGNLREHSNWRDGKRHGEFKWWNKNGELEEHSIWEKNMRIKYF